MLQDLLIGAVLTGCAPPTVQLATTRLLARVSGSHGTEAIKTLVWDAVQSVLISVLRGTSGEERRPRVEEIPLTDEATEAASAMDELCLQDAADITTSGETGGKREVGAPPEPTEAATAVISLRQVEFVGDTPDSLAPATQSQPMRKMSDAVTGFLAALHPSRVTSVQLDARASSVWPVASAAVAAQCCQVAVSLSRSDSNTQAQRLLVAVVPLYGTMLFGNQPWSLALSTDAWLSAELLPWLEEAISADSRADMAAAIGAAMAAVACSDNPQR